MILSPMTVFPSLPLSQPFFYIAGAFYTPRLERRSFLKAKLFATSLEQCSRKLAIHP
jgi:hypothetical protein